MIVPAFHGICEVTFRFFEESYGPEALEAYWRHLAETYYADLAERWRAEGLAAVEQYWRDIFEEEVEARWEIERTADAVTLRIERCPAFAWMEESRREVMPSYCDHCRVMNARLCELAGLEFELSGGRGSCVQSFREVPR